MQVEVIGSSVQFQSKYCVSIQEEEEKTMERPEVDEMDEEDRERKDVAMDVLENAVPDDCVYPGWIQVLHPKVPQLLVSVLPKLCSFNCSRTPRIGQSFKRSKIA